MRRTLLSLIDYARMLKISREPDVEEIEKTDAQIRAFGALIQAAKDAARAKRLNPAPETAPA